MKSTIKIGLIFLALSSFLGACAEEECNILSQVIVGQWTAQSLGSGTIEFSANSTLIDDNGLILDAAVNGIQLEDKVWALVGDSVLVVSVSDGANSLDRRYDIKAFECDRIAIEFNSVPADLNRR